MRLTVLPQLCSDVLHDQDFQKIHGSVTVNDRGGVPPLVICEFNTIKVEPSKFVANVTADCCSVSAKSPRYSYQDRMFIEKETQRLMKEGIIELNNSPWRAQVVLVTEGFKKWRLAIDYSETINRFTLFDSYPLPRIEDTGNKIPQY